MRLKIAALKIATRLATLHAAERWLSALAVGCLVALAVELAAPHRLDGGGDARASDAVAADAQPEPWRARPLEDYRAIAERPLFAFDRKPFVPPPAEPAPAQPVGPRVEFELAAVATSATTRMAFLKTNLSRGVVKLALDQTIEGWTLVEVRENAVVLRNGTEERTVQLQSNRAREKVGGAVALDTRARRQR